MLLILHVGMLKQDEADVHADSSRARKGKGQGRHFLACSE
jgi:hypothetical protein